jgi:hypothetical protein
LTEGQNQFVVFQDLVTQLKYIRNCRQLHTQGLAIELGSYQTHVFMDFREMTDDAEGQLDRLTAYLQGGGVASLERAGREMTLQPLHSALRELCQPEMMARQLEVFHGRPGSKKESALWQELEEKIKKLLSHASGNTPAAAESPNALETLLDDLLALRTVFRTDKGRIEKVSGDFPAAKKYLQKLFGGKAESERLCLLWLYTRGLVGEGNEKRPDNRFWFGEWLLDGILEEILRNWGFSESAVEPARHMIRIACGLGTLIRAHATALAKGVASVAAASSKLIKTIIRDADVQALLQVNRYKNDLFFNREAFNGFCNWLTILILWELDRHGIKRDDGNHQPASEVFNFMNFMPSMAAKAGYKLEDFLEKLAPFEVE